MYKLFLVLLIFSSNMLIAQENQTGNNDFISIIPMGGGENPTGETIYQKVDNMPLFGTATTANDSDSEVHNYLKIKASETNLEVGRVIAQFVVDEEGSVVNINIMMSSSEDHKQAAIKILENMPKWTPGSHQGKPAKVQYVHPIRSE